MKIKWLIVLLLFPAVALFSQKRKKAEKQLTNNLRTHINYLASDQLEGRRAGSKGEELAHNYITAQFSQMGLQPKGNSSGWLQPFEINDGREIKKSTNEFISLTALQKKISNGRKVLVLSPVVLPL